MVSTPSTETETDMGKDSNGNSAKTQNGAQPEEPTGSLEDKPVAATKEETNQDERKHFTRSKGGDKDDVKEGDDADTPNGDSVPKQRTAVEDALLCTPRSINECATILSKVDERSYQRAIVQDATSILEHVLFPISFPWSHSIIPVLKYNPKDIDDLPAILQFDASSLEHGTYGFGGFEVGKERTPTLKEALDECHEFRAATRRSDDVGVIELSIIEQDPSLSEFSRLSKRQRMETPIKKDEPPRKETTSMSEDSSDEITNNDQGDTTDEQNIQDEDINVPGELTYRHHLELEASKKRKLDDKNNGSTRLMVSVRCDSVSSRSSILEPEGTSRIPILFEAVLPNRKGRAPITSYYNNTTAEEWMNTQNRMKREFLLWTKPSNAAAGYVSTLTGGMVPAANCRKPRQVRVGVKLNGKLLTYKTTAEDDDEIDLEDSRAVDAAIDTACNVTVPPNNNASMCFLDCEELLKTILKKPPKRPAVSAGPSTEGISNRKNALCTPPKLECLPLTMLNGPVRVICTFPGTMKKVNVAQVFSNWKFCTICWEEEGDMQECTKCGTRVHLSCCSDPGTSVTSTVSMVDVGGLSKTENTTWTCALCSKFPPTEMKSPTRRRAANVPQRFKEPNVLLGNEVRSTFDGVDLTDGKPICTLCPHFGGAMSPLGDDNGWAHEVCRIWSTPKAATSAVKTRMATECALCGTKEKNMEKLIKCAGNDCTVRFHPMCALIAQRSDDDRNGDIPFGNDSKSRQDRDLRLAGRFELDILQCKDHIVPVGYCSFHNPAREQTLCGCYPGGFGSAMRVPPFSKR